MLFSSLFCSYHQGHFLMQIGLSVVGVMGADHSRKAFNNTKPSCQTKVGLGTPPSSFTCHISKYVLSFYQAASLATCQRNRAPG